MILKLDVFPANFWSCVVLDIRQSDTTRRTKLLQHWVPILLHYNSKIADSLYPTPKLWQLLDRASVPENNHQILLLLDELFLPRIDRRGHPRLMMSSLHYEIVTARRIPRNIYQQIIDEYLPHIADELIALLGLSLLSGFRPGCVVM